MNGVDFGATATSVFEGLLETLWMVVPAALLAQLVGLGIGLLLAHLRPGSVGARPMLYRLLGSVTNAGRSLPFVVLLVVAIPLTRLVTGTSIGPTAAIVPLTLAAIPFAARLVEAALLEVPAGILDAARSAGATQRQLLFRVLVPEAVPSLVRGFTVMVVSLVGYSAMAGAIGGGGLGDLAIRYGYQRFETAMLVGTVLALVGLVAIVQAFGDRAARRLDHR
ncbi:Methionine ABC transporter permease protein [Labilithrix luteola]|uniref:Methionine ABC transporter permease protein n=1 Tax=Labilithrix luteola TaxID=1391654 RepID=A0A0K1Q3V3_9BACT|nr:methionine ABC transporter permease [Labilithrix luteola]AKV00516.1 Methionine ABC transporter permease protein [Labilithrix luteola]